VVSRIGQALVSALAGFVLLAAGPSPSLPRLVSGFAAWQGGY